MADHREERTASRSPGRARPPARKIPWLLFPALLALAAVIGLAGRAYYAREKADLLKAKSDELTAIADLKIGQLVRWRQGLLARAEEIRKDGILALAVQDYLRAPAGARAEALRAWISALRTEYRFDSVLLLGYAGAVLTIDPPDARPPTAATGELVEVVERSGREMISDLHISPGSGEIHMDLVIPIPAPEPAKGPGLGTLFIRVDPRVELFPLIQSWPTPSPTAETLLVERDGEDILFLNELRHRKGTALRLRLPAASKDLPAAMAARGQSAVTEGSDYRRVPVLAAMRPVPGTPWFMVAKVDREEIMAPIRSRTSSIEAFFVLLFLAIGSALGYLWRSQRANYYKRVYEAEAQKAAMAKHYEYLTRYSFDMIFVLDESLRIQEANEKAISVYGYGKEEILNMPVQEIRAPQERDKIEGTYRSVKAGSGMIFETVHLRKDGTSFPVEVSTRLIDVEGKRYYQSVVRDISERKAAQVQILHLNRVYSVLSNVNQAIVRIRDRRRLLEEACRIAVEDGMFRMAWIGLLDDERRTILPAASAGRVQGYLDGFVLSLDDPVRKKGLTATALLTGRPAVSNDLEADERTAGWRDELLSRGYRSAASFPLVVSGGSVGTFSLYSSEKGFFNEREIALLNELASDLSFALEYLENKRKQDEAEEALKRQYEELVASQKKAAFFSDLIERSSQPLGVGFPDGRLGVVNEAFCKLVGYTREEIEKLDWAVALTPPEWRDREKSALEKLNRTNVPVRYEKEYIRKDGTRVPIELLVDLVRDPAGAPEYYYSFIEDITERKLAEQEIRDLNADLERRVALRTGQLEAANRELEAFSYSVSHDLRAPLRAIDGFSRIILEDYSKALDKEGGRLLGVIRENTRKMDQLIADLLAFSRVGRHELKLTDVDMGELAQNAFQELLPPEEKDRTTFRVSAVPSVRADAGLMRQLWLNLVSNALKFSGPKPVRTIEVGGELKDAEASFHIKDNGVGFDMRYAEKLFSPFQRLHSEREFPGTGIGLAIVQRIVSRHGGRVRAEGAVDEGAAFYFTLPIRRES